MQNSKRGFTLIELMIVVAIMAILAVVIGGFVGSCSDGDKESAMETMKTYAQEMGWEYVGGSCVDTDSDGDGYISCTARVRLDADGPVVEKDLECASGAVTSRTGGCKKAMPKVNVQGSPMSSFDDE